MVEAYLVPIPYEELKQMIEAKTKLETIKTLCEKNDYWILSGYLDELLGIERKEGAEDDVDG